MRWHFAAWIPWLYAGGSALCFFLYAKDKVSAIHARRRTPESTLLLVGLIGGWPGALVAQRLLRHKTSKRSFQIAFRISIALNLLALLIATLPWTSPLR